MASDHDGSDVRDFLSGHSLEITTKDVDQLRQARGAIADGASVSVTYLANDGLEARVEAAAAIRDLGLAPVPHISARRLRSAGELERLLERLAHEAAIDRVFVIAGDLDRAEGPYDDALAVIEAGPWSTYGVKQVGISGYPEGHPDIPDARLWRALIDKSAALDRLGVGVEITTQFGFDAAPIAQWIERVRARGIQCPIRVGLPGPASAKTLLRYAARCGVAASARVMGRYGLSMTRLLGAAGPDVLVGDVSAALTPEQHGEVGAHIYPFGGVKAAVEWALHVQRLAAA